jgi:hypothetical protein
MTDEIASEVAETSPEPEESSTPAIEETQQAEGPDSPPADADEPKRSRAEERIAELVAERAAAKEAGEYWRELAISLQNQPAEPAKPDLKPTLEQFDHDPEKYALAVADWTVKQSAGVAKAQVAEAIKAQASENEQAALKASWDERSAKFMESNPDFQAVISNPAIPISKDMADVFMESDQGPAIAYHLGKNPDVAARISRMPPRKMTLAIGRLERDVAASKPKPTKAPTPPSPVGGQQPSADIADMTIEEFMAKRNSEDIRVTGRR